MIKHYQRLCKTTSASSSSALDGSLAAAPGVYWAKVDFCFGSFLSLIQVPRLCSFVHNKINVPRGPGLFFVLPCTDIYEIIDMRVCFSIKLRPLYFMFNLGAKFFGPSPRDDHQGQRYCLRQCHHVLQGEYTTTPRGGSHQIWLFSGIISIIWI